MTMANTPELLAPAGDWEAIRAACANGADAVYFGLSNFNARARAANFEPDELPKVMKFLHDRNVKGFVTLNTLIFSDELPAVSEFISQIASAGVDAVIIQDVGLVRLIRKMVPSLHVHASTQMTITESRGVAAAKKLGIDRVVLARELSIADIRKITTANDMPVEVFVHGALCVAYSGQCLTSEALGGRSANRGQCAQACRLPYEMIVDGKKKELGDKAYLLSPQDLAAYELIDDLIQAGVISFKIEGRLKGGPYVAATTQTYRAAIDAAVAKKPFEPSRQQEIDLAQTFSRGFTPGFLDGVNHQKLVRGRFPKSRGVKLGTVVSLSKFGVVVELAETVPNFVKPGDGLLFDLGKPGENEPAGRVWEVRAVNQGSRNLPHVELLFGRDHIDFSLIPPGTTIWKTDDPALKKKLEQSYAQDKPARRTKVTATMTGTLGGPLQLQFSDGSAEGIAIWSGPLEVARNRPTGESEIREQLGRLGDTPYALDEVKIDLPGNVLIPKSVLNELRRSAAADLIAKNTTLKKHAIADPLALDSLRANFPFSHVNDTPKRLTVLVRNLDQLDAVLKHQPAMVYCDFEDLRRYHDAVPKARAAGVPIGLATLRILKPGEEGFQSMVVRAKPDAVLIRNLASLDYFKAELPQAKLIGDYSLNIANELTADYFIKEGCERIVPSFDLNWEQFAALLKRFDPSKFEPVVHQHMPMFHMEHCVFAAFLSTGKDHRDCGRPCDVHRVELKDRVGSEFPVHPDTGCRNTVFNSVPQSAAEYLPRMMSLGIRSVRIDLLRETSDEIDQLLTGYRSILDGRDDGKGTWRNLRAINQLGVTRGTLNLV